MNPTVSTAAIFLLAFILCSNILKSSAAPVLAAANPAQQIQFVYYCKPIHYLSTFVEWQRVDDGVYVVSSTHPIAKITVWISNFDPKSDALSMLGGDYENQVLGIETATPGEIVIQNLGTSNLSNDEWSATMHLVAYKLIALDNANVNLCGSYVGTYSKNINFKVTDVNNVDSNIFIKTMVVSTAVFIYTDVVVRLSDASPKAALSPPNSLDPSVTLETISLRK